MKYKLLVLFIFFSSFLFAQQNLVPNSSFENYTICPDNPAQVSYAIGWNTNGPNAADYYNACAPYPASPASVSVPHNIRGFQNAFDGNAYCGLYTYSNPPSSNYREYISSQLVSPLIIGNKYFVNLKVSCCDDFYISYGASNNIGVLFTTYQYHSYFPDTLSLNFSHVNSDVILTDTANWTAISGSFIADSSYEYINIGNFYPDYLTNYFNFSGNSSKHAYYYIDMVCVSSDSLTCNQQQSINETKEKLGFIIFPNPAQFELTINYTFLKENNFEIYDLLGAKRKVVILDIGSKNKNIDISELNNGLYFYVVVDKYGNSVESGKINILK